MGYFSLQFESKELEEKYQVQQQKYIKKSSNHLLYILSIGEFISSLDSFFHVQYIMLFFAISLIATNIMMIYLSRRQKIDVKLMVLYFNTLCVMSSIVQIIYVRFQTFLEFANPQIFVQLDIIHQFVALFNFGQSHIISSAIYILFIISRIYVQIYFGFTHLSIAFILFSLFYIKDQYQNAKQRRKQFLKSQRNKLLEQLIQDFINEKVCIIEKDEQNVKFVPIIINNQLQEFSSDINNILKEIKVCKSKYSVEQYLYLTKKEKETLLCQCKDQIFQVTYQRFILKTCQIFIKIQQIYHNQKCIIDYQDLYKKQSYYIQKIQQQCQQTKQIFNKLQINMFIYWFKKYYLQYHIKISSINIQQMKSIFKQFQYDIIQTDQMLDTFKTDKLLLSLLFVSLKEWIQERQVKITKVKQAILIEIYGIYSQHTNLENGDFINKTLFHIGIGGMKIHKIKNRQCMITFKLLDVKQKKFK